MNPVIEAVVRGSGPLRYHVDGEPNVGDDDLQVNHLFPTIGVSPEHVSGWRWPRRSAPRSGQRRATVLVFELRDYNVILPLMLATVADLVAARSCATASWQVHDRVRVHAEYEVDRSTQFRSPTS